MQVHPFFTRCRSEISRWLSVIAIAFLAFSLLSLILAGILAAYNGEIPARWGEYRGNHGPWRRSPSGGLVRSAIQFPLFSACAAFASSLIKPNPRALALVVVSLIVIVVVTCSHFWLID